MSVFESVNTTLLNCYMKSICKMVTLIVTVITFVGCDLISLNDVNPTYVNYWVSFENKTQHNMDITLVFGSYPEIDPSFYTYDYVLDAGGHFQASLGTLRDESGEELIEKLHRLIIPESVYIVYDNKYAISFERGSEDNSHLCKLSDYQMLNIHEYATACHYDFTEADYEYAKTYGKEVTDEDEVSY